MECEEFNQRLNELLDCRKDPAADPWLAGHARRCAGCEQALDDWLRIGRLYAAPLRESPATSCIVDAARTATFAPEAAFSAAVRGDTVRPGVSRLEVSRPAEDRRAGGAASGQWRSWSLAAAVGLAVVTLSSLRGPGEGKSERPGVADSAARTPALDLQRLGAQVNQPQWWGSVVRAAWEPVDPLAEGFRPLTNSLQTAFELLAPRARTNTALPVPLVEDANVGIAVDYSRLV